MIKDRVDIHECIEAAFSRSRKLGGSHYLIIDQRWLYRLYVISKWWLYRHYGIGPKGQAQGAGRKRLCCVHIYALVNHPRFYNTVVATSNARGFLVGSHQGDPIFPTQIRTNLADSPRNVPLVCTSELAVI